MNVKARNKAIAEKTAELDSLYPEGHLLITSRTDVSAVTEVSCAGGAKHLIEDSHTISTPEEIEAFRQRNDAIREQLQRADIAQRKPSLAITTEH